MPRPATLLFAVVLITAFAGTGTAAGAGARAADRVPAEAKVAELLRDRTALRAAPNGRRVGVIENRTSGAERVHLLVVESTIDDRENEWLRVRLPSRPNGSTAWILADLVKRRTTRNHVVIDRSARRLTVFRDGRRLFSRRVVVGTRATPTPTGHFALWDRYRPGRASPLHPWVLETTANSNVLQDFLGGTGRVALHGMQGSLRVPLGSAASHGCVRMTGRTVRWLARNLILGTPITVVP